MKDNSKAARERRRREAEARQASYDALTNQEKFDLAGSRPGNSRKERALLDARLKDA